MGVMRIAEIYQSTQGEGFLTGTESVFVRVSGCNLRCWFCDTPFASWHPEGEDLSVAEILRQIDPLGATHVVLTGGEPMLFAELIPICDQLRQRGRHITIETAGTLFLPVACDLMSISPKLSSSAPAGPNHVRWAERHQHARVAPDVIRRLVTQYRYQLKFVIDVPEELAEVESFLVLHAEVDRSRVMLMPQGTDLERLAATSSWLRPYCREHNLEFCPRKQIEWFGPRRRT
jgi:7-carboxy-7-deazaguanine synthase